MVLCAIDYPTILGLGLFYLRQGLPRGNTVDLREAEQWLVVAGFHVICAL